MLKRFAPPTPPSAPAVKPTAPVPDAPKQEAPKQEAQPAPAPTEAKEAGNKLIVGPNIKLKGSEITDCDILLVEGRVEASMHSRDMRIAHGGIFVGVAEIDTAEVRGEFEGELIARKRLVIHATGKVSGKIRYGALTVDEGGTLAGDVGSLAVAPVGTTANESRGGQPALTGLESTEDSAKSESVRQTHAAFGRSALHQR
jgi:cytoskeletal protein CcmA (bactofilin family)